MICLSSYVGKSGVVAKMVASVDQDVPDSLPDRNFSKEFYAKYEPKDILGRGVSSTVRKCLEKSTEKEYAVKIIDLTQEKDNDDLTEEMRMETKREINILQTCCQHPNIIELHDAFESEAFIFLIFEICHKGELFDYLTQVVTLSEKRTRQLMRQLLSAVEFIHAQNIVHRDLKPENILLDDDLNVKLSDFGFATEISHDEELTDLCGTPGYLAPEALKVSMYDDAPGYGRPVDMWACGVIMYTVLCGSPPFWHRKQMIMVRSIMEGRYSFPSPEWDDVGETAKDLISHLLVTDPKKRLTAAEALAHPFFKLREEVKEVSFRPRRKFKAGAYVIVAAKRIHAMRALAYDASLERIAKNPYAIKVLRKEIDLGAFKIYGHWVKKGENQNRAALFENNIKLDIKTSTASDVDSISTTGDGETSLTEHFEKFSPQVVVGDRVGRQTSAAEGLPLAALQALTRRNAARHGAGVRISVSGPSGEAGRRFSMQQKRSAGALIQAAVARRSQLQQLEEQLES